MPKKIVTRMVWIPLGHPNFYIVITSKMLFINVMILCIFQIIYKM